MSHLGTNGSKPSGGKTVATVFSDKAYKVPSEQDVREEVRGDKSIEGLKRAVPKRLNEYVALD